MSFAAPPAANLVGVAGELGEILGIEPLDEADQRRLPSLTRSVGEPILDCPGEILGSAKAARYTNARPLFVRVRSPRSTSRFITVCTVV
jgi:hypothetical protein